ncbi:GNAT family N-acetyltransferase [Halomonas marinisediminis]|uniref:GNAT family N-acetyltransferase n=1 Tax=Halomonas marinisediminis TaxID=2546095 RepID=A0ABY2D799_9GAMM|nr:GNAT family N-acetyltransferase [Halomonas marinisediminis]TDB02892.1 GNAT family N-acetyltransferase [Halomonas marinisediminis]
MTLKPSSTSSLHCVPRSLGTRAASPVWGARVLAPREHALHADALRRLSHEEQARLQDALVHGADLDTYLTEVLEQADIAVLTADGCLAGFCAFHTDALGQSGAFVALLVLSPEARRRGMVRPLLEATAASAVAKGFDVLALRVRHRDWQTIRFYLRQGFREAGRHGHELEMCLDLTGAFSLVADALTAEPRRYSAGCAGR